LGDERVALRKLSWFRHIEVPTVRFALQPLIVSDDNGLARNRR
jgi:hypothetical protein